jgi:hypothetical protein
MWLLIVFHVSSNVDEKSKETNVDREIHKIYLFFPLNLGLFSSKKVWTWSFCCD